MAWLGTEGTLIPWYRHTVRTSVPDVFIEEFGGNSHDQHLSDTDLQDKLTSLLGKGGISESLKESLRR
jgi:hypothetical protein